MILTKIEILGLPEGYEVGSSIHLCTYRDTQDIRIFLMKKEPEYIEVRDYLALDFRGKPIKMTLNADDFEWSERLESDSDFIRWIDKDPSKVEI